MKISNLRNEPQHVLVFGDPGSGKSTLVSQLAESGWKLIWISCDNGHHILRKLSPAAQERIELLRLPDTRDYPVAVDAFRQLFKYQLGNFCDMHGKHDCSICKSAGSSFTQVDFRTIPADTIVVFDNLSQLSDSYLSLICKGKPVDYKLQLDDWGSLLFHLKKALMDIQQAPFNMVCIAHAVEEAMVDGSKKIMPAVGSSQFAPKAAGYFDHVIYCHPMNNKHKFGSSTTYINNVVTKSRTDVAIEKMPTAQVAPFFDGAPPKLPSPAPVALQAAKEMLQAATPILTQAPPATAVTTSAVHPAPQPEAKQVSAAAAAMLAKLRSKGKL